MPEPAEDPRLHAGIALLGKTGASEFQMRYDEQQEPVIWMACAVWKTGTLVGAGLDPLEAVMRLLERAVDPRHGSKCAHCGLPASITDDWANPPARNDKLCWFIYDPEVKVFRRSCEGDTTGYAYGRNPRTGEYVSRNDQCPCGSGKKWKRCHGS